MLKSFNIVSAHLPGGVPIVEKDSAAGQGRRNYRSQTPDSGCSNGTKGWEAEVNTTHNWSLNCTKEVGISL